MFRNSKKSVLQFNSEISLKFNADIFRTSKNSKFRYSEAYLSGGRLMPSDFSKQPGWPWTDGEPSPSSSTKQRKSSSRRKLPGFKKDTVPPYQPPATTGDAPEPLPSDMVRHGCLDWSGWFKAKGMTAVFLVEGERREAL